MSLFSNKPAVYSYEITPNVVNKISSYERISVSMLSIKQNRCDEKYEANMVKISPDLNVTFHKKYIFFSEIYLVFSIFNFWNSYW